jgi:hypothetical protein
MMSSNGSHSCRSSSTQAIVQIITTRNAYNSIHLHHVARVERVDLVPAEIFDFFAGASPA